MAWKPRNISIPSENGCRPTSPTSATRRVARACGVPTAITSLSRELYQRDNLTNAFKQEGKTIRNKSLDEIAAAIGISTDELKTKYLDPKVVLNAKGEDTPEKSGILKTWAVNRMVPDIAVIALKGDGPLVTKDEDGDINVSILSANPAVDPKSLKLPAGATGAAAVPYDAATHGRDYWLSPGAPHCADCHAAPFVEGQGGVAFPINQPGKYSNMRYSKGPFWLVLPVLPPVHPWPLSGNAQHGLHYLQASDTVQPGRIAWPVQVRCLPRNKQGRCTEYRGQEGACVEWQAHPAQLRLLR